jgi:hypothetical protein
MDNELLYGDPESDPITNPNAVSKINANDEAALGQIYSNATSLTSEPIIPGAEVDFETTLQKTADINGAAAGASSGLSGFSQISATICINGTPTTGTILFKAD